MRTDGDTWNIVSSVGLTALGVATFRAVESRQPDALIRDDCAHLFVEAAGEPRFLEALTGTRYADGSPAGAMIGLRTKFFDEFFLAAAAAGIHQVVIVAAGLDARAYRLDWPVGTTVFEIDQPKVLEFKHEVLADNGIAAKAVLRSVPVDLREDWPAALVDAGFDTDRPSAWSAEGLLPYLPGAAQDSLFEQIDTLSAPGSRLSVEGFTGRPDITRVSAAEPAKSEANPLSNFNVSQLFYDDERSDLAQWLTDRGWDITSATVTDLAAQYDRPVPQLPDVMAHMINRATYINASK